MPLSHHKRISCTWHTTGPEQQRCTSAHMDYQTIVDPNMRSIPCLSANISGGEDFTPRLAETNALTWRHGLVSIPASGSTWRAYRFRPRTAARRVVLFIKDLLTSYYIPNISTTSCFRFSNITTSTLNSLILLYYLQQGQNGLSTRHFQLD
jgi:hypothetical protein